MGWLEAPDLAGGNNGSTTAQPKVFLTLTFSQPVLSVSPADIQVNLTEATVSAPSNSTSPQVCTSCCVPSGVWLTLLWSTSKISEIQFLR